MKHAEIETRVDNGWGFMEEHGPEGWWKPERFDLDQLSIRNADSCVLGQVFASRAHHNLLAPTGYHWALFVLMGGAEFGMGKAESKAMELGFCPRSMFMATSECEMLNKAWEHRILVKRAEANLVESAEGIARLAALREELVSTS